MLNLYRIPQLRLPINLVCLLGFTLALLIVSSPSSAVAQSSCVILDKELYYNITAKHSGQLLTVAGASQVEQASVIQQPASAGAENQKWHLAPIANDSYHILVRHSGKALSLYNYTTADNAPISQADPSNNAIDDWCFQDSGGGEYNIIVGFSGKALTVAGGSQADGASVIQAPLDPNADHQKWTLTTLPPEGNGTGIGNLTYGTGQVSRVAKLMLDFPTNAGNAFGMNNGVMTNGHLVGVFAPDHGTGPGGLDVYNVSDPHLPSLVGRVIDSAGVTSKFRETHAIGTWNQNGSNYVIFNNCCGVEIWDLQDPQNPAQVSTIDLPDLAFGNYSNNAWQLFVQAPYVYVGGTEKGLYVVDISNPAAPQLVKHLPISATGGFRIGPIYALGNRLIISSMGFPSTDGFSILNIDDPTDPQLIFSLPTVPEYYTICTNGTLLAFANTSNSAQHIYDISGDDATLVSNSLVLNDPQYCSFQDDHIFWGGETIYKVDVSDPANPVLLDESGFNVFFPDHSQVTPMGNLFWGGNDHGTGNGFIVHQAVPDTAPPVVQTINPANGNAGVSRCSPIGIAFSDYIDLATVSDQTFIVRPVGGQAIGGSYSSMVSTVNFVADNLLSPSTTYEIFLPSGGVKDIMGNGVAFDQLTTFTTAQNSGCESESTPVLAATLSNIAPHVVNSSVNMSVVIANNSNPNPEVSWDFGDGSSTGFSTATATTHTYAEAGHYQLIATVRDGAVETTATAFVTIHYPLTSQSPNRSRVLVHNGSNIFVVNQDNDSLTAISDASLQPLWEVPTGDQPRSVAIAPNGDLWVANELSDTVTIHSATDGALLNTITLDYGARPFGIAFSPDGSAAYLSLYASGELLKLSPAGAITGQLAVGPTPRGIAISADSTRLFITRFISPDSGGEIIEINPSSMSLIRTFALAPDTTTQDSDSAARGIANYLDSITITPDGLAAWVGAKKDNIFRGSLRDGQALTFETSVRALTAELDLLGNSENVSGHVDYDNSALPGGAAFTPLGDYAFVSLKGNNLVSIRDRFSGTQVGELVAEDAPDDLLLNADGSRVYIHNFLARSVTIYDVTGFRDSTDFTQQLLGTVSTVANESLSAQELTGKQIFYNAIDSRMTNQGYLSCATCHMDGDQDGRVWDFTQSGEGLRNTTDLNGAAGTGHGILHWSGNFDEIQDFENQIRTLQGGAGFMTNADFTATQDTLGAPKAGLSSELDALAAYVASLADSGRSPHRSATGTLTSSGAAGRTLFENSGCTTCHLGEGYTDSQLALRHDIGTIQSSSGNRLGGTLDGLDSPTLRGLWRGAPYLHDGSAATVAEAVNAHSTVSLPAADVAQIADFLLQLDESEPAMAPPGNGSPVITNPGNQSNQVADTVSLPISATDPESDPLLFSATGLPSGLTINSSSGLISGSPLVSDTYTVTVMVDDSLGGTDSANFEWTVEEVVTGTTGQILWERWDTVFGTTLDTLRNDPDFPANPDQTDTFTSTITAINQGDTFGQRMRGLIYPPVTGQYTFWISSDDQGELWLSSDDTAAASSLIANVPNFTSSPTDWTFAPEQQSAQITLQAGQAYYIEALSQDGGSSDFLAVAWQIPNGALEIIDGQYLSLPINHPPTAIDDGATLDENSTIAIDVLANDSDVDSDPLTIGIVGQPSNGSTALNPDETISYTPTLNFIGTDIFTYTVDDGNGEQAEATVTVTVSDFNDPPTAVDDSATVDEDAILNGGSVLINDTDPETDPLTATIESGVTYGELLLNLDGTFVYTPTADFFGSDTFSYRANDEINPSNIATVSITVNPISDAPTAVDDSGSTIENSAVTLNVLLNDIDVDGDTLMVTTVGQPSNGLSAINPDNTITYTPTLDFLGTDSFSYTVDDGNGGQDQATVTITVNDPATQVIYTLQYEIDYTNVPPLSYQDLTLIIDVGSVSAASVTAGGVTVPHSYDPVSGLLQFTADASPVEVTLTNPADVASIGSPAKATLKDDKMWAWSIGFDDNTNLKPTLAMLETFGYRGTVFQIANIIDDTRIEPWIIDKPDMITYLDNGWSLGNHSWDHECNQSGDRTATIIDGYNRIAQIASESNRSSYKVISFAAPCFDSQYHPYILTMRDAATTAVLYNESGSNFPLVVDSSITADFTLNGKNIFAFDFDDPIHRDFQAGDAPLGAITEIDWIASQASSSHHFWHNSLSHGNNLANVQQTVTYLYNTYGAGGTDEVWVAPSDHIYSYILVRENATVTLLNTNTKPMAIDDVATVDEDAVLNGSTVLVNDSDLDTNPLTATLESDVTNGLFTLNLDGTFVYTPTADFHGVDSFTYRAHDGTASSNSATVSITVNPVNDAPVAVDDNGNTDENTPITLTVLTNDSDIDGDTPTVATVGQPENGTAAINVDETITYAPNLDFSGTDTFTYTIDDGNGGTAEATVTIIVSDVLQPPGEVTQSLPSGEIGQSTPTFVWDVEPTATEYTVVVYRPSIDEIVFMETYLATEVCGVTACIVQPTAAEMTLVSDLYTWLVRAANLDGVGPWSTYSE